MPPITTPEHIKIKSLEKKTASTLNVMQPGEGTPWENRGELGYVSAFFASLSASLSAPVKHAWAIRRPDAGGDALAFGYGLGVMWALGVLTHAALLFFLLEAPDGYTMTVFADQFWIRAAVVAVLVGGASGVVVSLIALVFDKATGFDRRQPVRATLVQAVTAYGLAPTALVAIPVVGPIVAALWSTLTLGRLAAGRLDTKPAGAWFGAIITWVVIALVVVVGWYVIGFGVDLILGPAVEYNEIPTPTRGGI